VAGQKFFCRERVKQGLQRLAASDQLTPRSVRVARFMIGDARCSRGIAFDEVD
jgi:hypothetical protein